MMIQSSGEDAEKSRMKFLGGTAVLAILIAVLIAAPAGAATKSKSKAKKTTIAVCANATLVPTKTNQVKRLQKALRCLVNQERTKRGLKALKLNMLLQTSSDWQAQDMLIHQYFDHSRPGGPEFADRILHTGYARGGNGYLIGENLAWASTPIASPKAIVKMWMNSPPHRKNILTKDFREQGMTALWSEGGVGGAYAGSTGPFLIFVNQFGRVY
ncbi:MAG: CAP domain-containing protein [Solirubrobacterales bacterium]